MKSPRKQVNRQQGKHRRKPAAKSKPMSARTGERGGVQRTSTRSNPPRSAGGSKPAGPPPGWNAGKKSLLYAGLLIAFAVFVWSYWPTLTAMVASWESNPDYSHGYLVVPLALFFLWARRDRLPELRVGFYWPGLALIGLSILVRYFGALVYLDSIDGWSVPLFVGGAVWLLGGWQVFLWALPSVAFLWFMIPLPFRAETILSGPLQDISTHLSCWTLQCLGQPALAEGNTILVDDFRFEVAQACSGLRIFVGIAALAFAYVIIVRRPWWQKLLLLAAVAPIAVLANATRIVLTALLHELVSAEVSHKFTHDLAGYVMIPYAALLFGLLLVYLGWLIHEAKEIDVRSVVREQKELR